MIRKLDATLFVTRPLWTWLGQVAVVILGTHLAADRLDDALGRWLSTLPLPWPDPQVPLDGGLWLAIGLEFFVALWAVWALARAVAEPVSGPKEWASRVSIHNLFAPAFWLVVSLAGCWTIAMAVEDGLAWPPYGTWIAWATAVVVAVRMTMSGCWQLLRSPPVPKRRFEGWFSAPILVLVGTFAFRYGLPIWGLW